MLKTQPLPGVEGRWPGASGQADGADGARMPTGTALPALDLLVPVWSRAAPGLVGQRSHGLGRVLIIASRVGCA
jgi:hypothetical protein